MVDDDYEEDFDFDDDEEDSPRVRPVGPPALEVKDVSKRFCRDLKRSLFYGVQDISRELVGRPPRVGELKPHEFWALQDINLELPRGTALGLVGTNGSGKTTLMRIISGLIKPTTGSVTVRGRLAPLLALGAGFNPVLTGRENIYTNMSILGLTKEEIKDRLVEEFGPEVLATPDTKGFDLAAWIVPGLAIVLVGGGSADPAANADVHRVSRLLWETYASDYLTVETAYISPLARPGVPGGLERCRRLGAKRVIVLPYHVFADSELERVWAQAMAYAAGHEGLDIRCAEAIGDCEGLADAVIERYEEALTVELADHREMAR